MKVEAHADGDAWRCQVTVDDTVHDVRVSAADLKRWGRGTGHEAVQDLVTRSFGFLLEREPAASILETFDLSVIPRYFPEFDRIIRRGPD